MKLIDTFSMLKPKVEKKRRWVSVQRSSEKPTSQSITRSCLVEDKEDADEEHDADTQQPSVTGASEWEDMIDYYDRHYRILRGDIPLGIRSGIANPLRYLKDQIITICKNHVVTNTERRFSKYLTSLIKERCQERKLDWRSAKFPLRWLVDHLIKAIVESGGTVAFSLPEHKRFQKKRSHEDFQGWEVECREAFLEATKWLGNLSLKGADILDKWQDYFPLLFHIQKCFERHRDAWEEHIKEFPREQQKAIARLDFRGGKLCKAFSPLPEFSDKCQAFLLCGAGLATIAKRDTQRIRAVNTDVFYEALWHEFFDIDCVLAKQYLQHRKRTFHYTIRTDGVTAYVHVNVVKDMNRKPPPCRMDEPVRHSAVVQVDSCVEPLEDFFDRVERAVNMERPVETVTTNISLIRSTSVTDLLGKLLIVVDPGKNPLFSAAYFKTAAALDADGNLVYAPYHLNSKQRRQFCHQRRWNQRKTKRSGLHEDDPLEKVERQPSRRYKGDKSEETSVAVDHCSRARRVGKPRLKRQRLREVAGELPSRTKRERAGKRSSRAYWQEIGEQVKGTPPAAAQQTKNPNKRNRRYYGHVFQPSLAYWQEISGQVKGKEKLKNLQKKHGMNNIYTDAIDYRRHRTSPSKHAEYVRFTYRTLSARLTFQNLTSVKRLRLDKYLCTKRAEGELVRRFFPAGIPMNNIVVIWGDGDFKHNLAGTPSSPKDRIAKIMRRGIRGGTIFAGEEKTPLPRGKSGEDPGKLFRPGFMMGCEFKSSQMCHVCCSELQDVKFAGIVSYRVRKCSSRKVEHRGRDVFFERYAPICSIESKSRFLTVQCQECPTQRKHPEGNCITDHHSEPS